MQIAKTTMVMEGFVEEVAFELKPEGWERAIHGRAEEEYSRQSSARATAWRLDIERNQHDWRVVGEGRLETGSDQTKFPNGNVAHSWRSIPNGTLLSLREVGLGDLPQIPVWVSVDGTLMLGKAR